MTEAEWLACDDPAVMNRAPAPRWWGASDPLVRLGARRKRLLAVTCARLVAGRLAFPGVAEALDAFERHADGDCDRAALRAARVVAEQCLQDCDRRFPRIPIAPAVWPDGYHPERQAAILVREAGRTAPTVPVGDRWGYWDCLGSDRAAAADLVRDIVGNPFRPVPFDPAWRTGTAVSLASQMYESRDFGVMPILADALQDTGCDNEHILRHCRDATLTHVRGCWVVDLVLGKP